MSTIAPHRLETTAFREASFIIEESGVAETVRSWLDEDEQHPELSDVDIHNVLSGWVGAAFAGLPLTEANVVRVLRTSPVRYEASEEDVREITQQVLAAMDHRPSPAGSGSLSKTGHEDRVAKRARYLEFSNAILRAQRDTTEAVDDTHA